MFMVGKKKNDRYVEGDEVICVFFLDRSKG